eukprot:gb/GEZN01017482.1/.p1 GENE.gb/GEZN01017482.1/~~gb/GEZN01017482.1/.p1  ORF type:complete len:230 (-),score=52.46 gb/GEZN01017482.1/:108-764(-)
MSPLFFLSLLSILLATQASKGAVKAHVKHLLCPVCEEATDQLLKHVQTMTEDVATRRDKWEAAVLDYMDNLCSPSQPQGKWLTKFDVVLDKETGKISLADQMIDGACNQECNTMARACNQVFDEIALEILETLSEGKLTTKSKLQNKICRKINGACKGMKKKREEAKKAGTPAGKVPALGAEEWMPGGGDDGKGAGGGGMDGLPKGMKYEEMPRETEL